ncbi:MAG: restriction endonuclease [Fusobacteriaceae bacterium]
MISNPNSLDYLMEINPDAAKEILSTTHKPVSEDKVEKIQKGYERLNDFHVKENKIKTTEQGDLLEELVLDIFSENNFDIITNKRTTTNEIDLLIKIKNYSSLKMFGIIPDWMNKEYFLIECKNYTSNVGVTYLNKFHSLLTYTGSQVGLFISYNGVTGTNKWKDARGLINKINLMNKANEKLPIILDINKSNMITILEKNKYNVFNWLKELKINHDFELFEENEKINSDTITHENQNFIQIN